MKLWGSILLTCCQSQFARNVLWAQNWQERGLEPFVAILRFAGLPATLVGIALAFLDFWSNVGSDSFTKVAAKSALVAISMSFLTLLAGAVVYQLRDGFFSASDAVIAGAILALPVILAFLIWATTSMTPSIESLVFGVVGLLFGWAGLALFAFLVIFLVPRTIGFPGFGR